MKLGKLLLGALLVTSFTSFSQDDPERECKRMRFLAGEELKIKNYVGAATYYLKGEEICGGYDAANYARLIGSLRNAQNSVTDKAAKGAYADTLEGVYQRAEKAGVYDQKDDLFRAANILQTAAPDRALANTLFERGIAAQGEKTNQAYVSYYYYNVYAMYAGAQPADQPVLKAKMISVYFELSTLISKANMSAQTQETITGYFNAVVKSCDDILPDLKGYMGNLPSDPEVKKVTVNNFITLLEKKECTSAPEYIQLIDTLVDINPESFEAQLMLAKAKIAKGEYSGALGALRNARDLTEDAAQIDDVTYLIAYAQLKSGSYTSAYNTAMTIKGDNRGKALSLAGQAVAKNANNCGTSTFERKCNYIYAVQLLQQAQAAGESVGSIIGSYKNNYPTDGEIFENGSPSSVSLSCYGVTVNL